MTPSRTVRSLLVVSDPAPWVPNQGCGVRNWAFEVCRAPTLEEARGILGTRDWDVVAFRVASLRPLSPPLALAALREIAPEATFLPVTDTPDPREALAYLKQGAFEYLEEPLAPDEFLRALGDAIENRNAFLEILDLNRTLETQKEQLLREKQELTRRNRELEAVSRLSRELGSTLEVEEILNRLLASIRETFSFDLVVAGLLDGAGRKEEARAGLRFGEPLPAAELARMSWQLREVRRNPWIRSVLHEGRELWVRIPSSHPETRETPLAEIHGLPFAKIPLRARGQVLGSITVEGRALEAPGFEDEVGTLRIFADTAALAVENARLYQTMKELSVRDELTGLYNRRHLLRQLEAEWNHANRHEMPLALLMLDLDHFKRVNDEYDHFTGDAALKKVAAALVRNTRGIDTAARYGGEEFVVVLPRADRKSAQIVGEKLRRVVEKIGIEGETALPPGALTVSVGVAAYPEDAPGPKELLERADWALYRAKSEGRNRVCAWEGEQRAQAG